MWQNIIDLDTCTFYSQTICATRQCIAKISHGNSLYDGTAGINKPLAARTNHHQTKKRKSKEIFKWCKSHLSGINWFWVSGSKVDLTVFLF